MRIRRDMVLCVNGPTCGFSPNREFRVCSISSGSNHSNLMIGRIERVKIVVELVNVTVSLVLRRPSLIFQRVPDACKAPERSSGFVLTSLRSGVAQQWTSRILVGGLAIAAGDCPFRIGSPLLNKMPCLASRRIMTTIRASPNSFPTAENSSGL